MQTYTVARDDSIYQAFPDVALTPSGRLVCTFAEMTHHGDRGYTRIMLTESADRGVTWSPPRGLTDPQHGEPWWNCPRISTLGDGRLALVCDQIAGKDEGATGARRQQHNLLWLSSDEGATWQGPHATPVEGIVPDQLIELRRGQHAGRWLLASHTRLGERVERWCERLWYSDDRGATWAGPVTVAEVDGLRLCEGSIVELPDGELVCFMRENTGRGLDAFKTVSTDAGLTWTEPIDFPMPACHRPVAGMLQSGRVLITHRFMQGGKGWVGWWTQNLFAALTDVESCLATQRHEAHTRIFPISFDRSRESDTGYSGWVQFDDGLIYIVNYLLDDAPKAYIRGHALREDEMVIE